MIIKIILLIVWIVACCIEGIRDGHYFYDKMISEKPEKENIHYIFTLERGIIMGLMIGITLYAYPCQMKFYDLCNLLPNIPIMTTIFMLGLCLIFSFIHNSFYQEIRHKLDERAYPDGWLDSSTTSTSFLDFNFISRTIQFIAGIILITLTFFL